jgi:hypothetical protein
LLVLSYLAQSKDALPKLDLKLIDLFPSTATSFISTLNWIFPDFSISTFLKLNLTKSASVTTVQLVSAHSVFSAISFLAI